ncbi:MAG: D-aminoacyl-tRNA deacylase [Fervidicoccaceae archaeon]
MRILYAYSEQDIAGVGIAKSLKGMVGDEAVRGFAESVVEFSFLENFKEFDSFLILSRHRSESKIPCLTVHSTGNLLKTAILGGRGEELSMSFPRLNGFLLKGLRRRAEKAGLLGELRVTYEATHHGPSNLNKPITFIEIGSDESMWKREDLHFLVAETVYEAHELLTENSLPECEKAIGFGGGHYSERHTELTLTRGVCFGHIAPKHAIREGLSEKVLSEMFDKNYEGIESAYVEKKAGNRIFREQIEKAAMLRKVRVNYF